MFQNANNNHEQSNIGLGSAIAWLTSNHYTVSIPLNDTQSYDLIAEIKGHLRKIQVKTASGKQVELRSYTHSMRKPGVNFTGSKVDFVFILTNDARMYFIPRDRIANKRSVSIAGKKYAPWLVSFRSQINIEHPTALDDL